MTCDLNTRPNGSNCQCVPVSSGGFRWACGCADGSEGADNHNPALIYGCPPGKIRDGDCCVCSQPQTCDPGCTWDTLYCRCVDFVGQPCSAATPTPNSQPGGGSIYSRDYSQDYYYPFYNGYDYCTPHVWVYYVSYDNGETWVETGETEYAGCW